MPQYSQQDLNLCLLFRRELFYPLNYESIYTAHLHRPAVFSYCSHDFSPIILLNHLERVNTSSSSSDISL